MKSCNEILLFPLSYFDLRWGPKNGLNARSPFDIFSTFSAPVLKIPYLADFGHFQPFFVSMDTIKYVSTCMCIAILLTMMHFNNINSM